MQHIMAFYDQESPNFVPIGPSVALPALPWSGPPNLAASYYFAIKMLRKTEEALEKATIAGKEYTADGLNIKRYDLKQLQDAYIFWETRVNQILRFGDTSTMSYRRIIPLDLG